MNPASPASSVLSRRGVLQGALTGALTGALGTAVSAVGCATTPAGSPYHEVPDGGFPDTGNPVGTYDAGVSDAADVSLLNTLLTVEYGAIAAYNAVGRVFASPPMGDPLAGLSPTLAAITTAWLQHHQTHATVLVSAVAMARGTAITAASVSFNAPHGYTPTVLNALKLLGNAERALAVAHANAVSQLQRADRRFLVASVCGDEAQHYAVLDTVVRSVLAPLPGMTAAVAMDTVPAAFVADYASGYSGLQSLPDLAYG